MQRRRVSRAVAARRSVEDTGGEVRHIAEARRGRGEEGWGGGGYLYDQKLISHDNSRPFVGRRRVTRAQIGCRPI